MNAILAFSVAPAHAGNNYQTWILAAVLVATLLLLATEKLHKTILVLLSGLLCLFLGDRWHYFPHSPGQHLPVYIDMIEWEVIGIVIGATIFVEIASRSGIFTFVSIKILKASRGDPFRLLIYLSVLTAVFSAFLDNITAMIIVGSLTVVACRKLELDIKPYLITEGIMTNVGGLLTLISSIPNIIVGKAADISYLKFVMVAGPYTIVAIAVSMILAKKIFGAKVHPLVNPQDKETNLARVTAFDEWETIEDRRFFYTSIVAVILVILAFALKARIPILRDFGIEIVAIGAAVIMMLLHAKDVEKDLERVEWSLVFFFVGLFVIIGVMEKGGVLAGIGKLLAHLTGLLGNVGLMWFTALFSSVTDNIPLAAMLGKIFGPTPDAAAELPQAQWWAVVFGANLGGNITPIGSASTVVACTILKKNDMEITFMEFVKIGGTFALAQLILASGYILLLEKLL